MASTIEAGQKPPAPPPPAAAAVAPARSSAPAKKDSMKSTWRASPDRTDWTIHHWLIELLNAHPIALDQPIPVFSKEDKIPYLHQLPQHIWILAHTFIPLAIHQLLILLLPLISIPGISSSSSSSYLGKIPTFLLYFLAFNGFVIRQVQILCRLGHRYGFLDGDLHSRDGIPDVGVVKVASSLYKTTGSRLLLAVQLSYNPQISPLDAMSSGLHWWLRLALEIGLYSIILDFWFYWYHRAMHDLDGLWKFHRTHHLTKHPNPLLTAYADHEQEFFDMVGVPLMTWLTFRYLLGIDLGFYEWWICHQYVVFTEVFGHSGLRVHVTAPSTLSWLLQWMDCEIVTEDHDLHHRKGWRKSHNYGKQTRLWDRVFGTCHERIESKEGNVDYEDAVRLPFI